MNHFKLVNLDKFININNMTPEEQKLAKSRYYKKWYEANKEALLIKQKARSKKDYASKPEVYAARTKKWREENPEKYKKLMKVYRDENRELYKQRSADWYANNKEHAARRGRKNKLKRYGLTQETFDRILESQNGVCAICGTTEWGSPVKNIPHVDHCHTSGKVRGLLCHQCNTAIGHLKDNPEIVMSAYNYLIKSQKDVNI